MWTNSFDRGVMLADYHVIRRAKLKLDDLYTGNSSSIYWFHRGVNWRAIVAFFAGVWPLIRKYFTLSMTLTRKAAPRFTHSSIHSLQELLLIILSSWIGWNCEQYRGFVFRRLDSSIQSYIHCWTCDKFLHVLGIECCIPTKWSRRRISIR
jgi:hypothetical protein